MRLSFTLALIAATITECRSPELEDRDSSSPEHRLLRPNSHHSTQLHVRSASSSSAARTLIRPSLQSSSVLSAILTAPLQDAVLENQLVTESSVVPAALTPVLDSPSPSAPASANTVTSSLRATISGQVASKDTTVNAGPVPITLSSPDDALTSTLPSSSSTSMTITSSQTSAIPVAPNLSPSSSSPPSFVSTTPTKSIKKPKATITASSVLQSSSETGTQTQTSKKPNTKTKTKTASSNKIAALYPTATAVPSPFVLAAWTTDGFPITYLQLFTPDATTYNLIALDDTTASQGAQFSYDAASGAITHVDASIEVSSKVPVSGTALAMLKGATLKTVAGGGLSIVTPESGGMVLVSVNNVNTTSYPQPWELCSISGNRLVYYQEANVDRGCQQVQLFVQAAS